METAIEKDYYDLFFVTDCDIFFVTDCGLFFVTGCVTVTDLQGVIATLAIGSTHVGLKFGYALG